MHANTAALCCMPAMPAGAFLHPGHPGLGALRAGPLPGARQRVCQLGVGGQWRVQRRQRRRRQGVGKPLWAGWDAHVCGIPAAGLAWIRGPLKRVARLSAAHQSLTFHTQLSLVAPCPCSSIRGARIQTTAKMSRHLGWLRDGVRQWVSSRVVHLRLWALQLCPVTVCWGCPVSLRQPACSVYAHAAQPNLRSPQPKTTTRVTPPCRRCRPQRPPGAENPAGRKRKVDFQQV